MDKLWQNQWFGINFKDFSTLDPNNIGDEEFYKKFYSILYDQFPTYDSLPAEWRKAKIENTQDIFFQCIDKSSILSIGAGTGFVEETLHSLFVARGQVPSLSAIEPNVPKEYWPKNSQYQFIQGYFPDVVKGQFFDLAYAVNIDYCFTDAEYLHFLRSILDFGISDLLLAGLDTMKHSHGGSIRRSFKNHVRTVLARAHLSTRKQFWGYLRSLDDQIILLTQAGFKDIQVGQHNFSGDSWIRASAICSDGH